MDEKDELNNYYGFTAVNEMIKSISDQNKKALEPITLSLNILQEQINNSIKISLAPALKAIELNMSGISLMLKDLYKNPEGVLNFFEYMHKLDGFYWSMPYGMNGNTLNKIINSSGNDKLFDLNMSRYFSKKRMNELFKDTIVRLPRNKRILYKQIQNAFNSKSYQLVNGPIIALIDDTLSVFLDNKGNTKRKDILLPILEDMEESDDWFLYVFISMLSNNLSTIFNVVDLHSEIIISNSKKIRRHAIQHGKFSGSNKRIESIMLLNTLFNSVITVYQLEKYHNKISYKKNSGYYLNNHIKT